MRLKMALPIAMTTMLSRGSNRCEYERLLTALLASNNGHRKEMNERDYDMVDDMEGMVQKSHEETDGGGEGFECKEALNKAFHLQ
ncbi:hypothetical protein TNCV_3903071 [Trichonephila clavipes]|nr:hypothetical protein TNCV_3903071 [Trichonephila clavipes]